MHKAVPDVQPQIKQNGSISNVEDYGGICSVKKETQTGFFFILFCVLKIDFLLQCFGILSLNCTHECLTGY
jgi:hypothetical protein